MPDLEISNLPALAEAGIAATDPLAIADLSASETKKVTVKDLIEAGVALIDAGSIPSAKVASLGSNQVATGSIIDGAVTNVKLANSSVSLGGISISLGGTDATPAFNLTDATNYPTSSLTGTITNAQLAGSIVNSKLANSSVSFGGISLALGGTDATPAFNLTDATGYKTTELVGTITNAQLAGSIDVSKLTGSAVSLGGVSVALGGTDATPAFNLTDATGYPTSSLVGTITNAQLAGSIANAKLANSSVSLGGVSIALGGTDATPAFNLADATGYPTSSLVGTITNAQLAGSIDVSKLAGTTAISLGGVSISLGGTDATPAFDLTDATNYPAASLTGTISNAQLAGSIANAKLVNSSVSLGGVTVALGASDATPAFDLTDATNYPTSSLTGTITNAQLAGSIAVSKLVSSSASIGGVTITLGATDATPAFDLQDATGYPTSALVGTITNAQLAGSIAATKLVAGSITSTQLGANSVTDSELANNAVDTGAVQNGAITNDKVETSTSATTGLDGATKIRDATITPAKLNTSNLDRSLNVASGNLGINNTITAATRSGISYNAQGLITGTVALAAADLPVATSSAVGGVSVSTGLTVNGSGALSLTNSVTGATVSGITFNNQGMITAATALVAGDLPTATTSAKGAVQITSGGGLTVDGSGNLTTSTSGISAGTYQSITVNNKGVATAGAALTAALIPSLAASKITSGSFDAARIANDSIDGSKLSNASTAIFQSVAQSGYPTAQFSGQILFDTVSEDAWIWDGNAWQAITTLTKGSLVFGGNFNANTSKMTACTSAGLAAGLAVGSNLPTPSATTDGLYVVVDTAGTPSAPAPVVAFSPPDYILGVTNASGSSWNEIDLSQTVAGQVASNITFTPYGQISSTNVQDALQELETEKLALAGGTITGQVLIGNTGSLVFEGSSIDAYQTIFAITNPTQADRTITFPDLSGTVITDEDTGTVTGTMLANGTIQNVNIKSDAAIAYSKLASVASGYILVGNGASTSVAAAVAVTGDISINNAGLTSIASNVIVDADIKSDAAISGSKIVQGTTSVLGVLQLTDAADSASTTTAATPAAVKIAKDAADAAQTTADAALPKAGGTLTDNLLVDNDKEVRFFEADSNGSTYVGIKGATDKGSEGSYTISLPAASPTAGQILKANASTPTTLEWTTDAAIDASKMPLAGGTFTGDVTFTGDSSDGLWDKSASAFVADLTGNVIGNVTGNVTGNTSGSSGSCTGNAATATALATARNIGGVSFDGTAAINLPGVNASGTQDTSGTAALATQFSVTANNSTDETVYPLFADGATGAQGAETDTGLTYNPSTGLLTSTGFAGALTGNVTGNVSGSAATVTAAAQSAITSLGTLTGLTVDGDLTLTGAANNVVWDKSDNALEFADSAKATFGTGGDLTLRHNGTDTYIDNITGGFYIRGGSNSIHIRPKNDENSIVAASDGSVQLYYDNSKRIETTSTGVGFHGGADNCYVILKDVSGNYCWQLIGYDAVSAGAGGRLVMADADGNTVMDMRDAGTNIFIKNSLRLDVDDLKIELGASQDLQLYHDGSNSFLLNSTGNLYIQGDSSSTTEEILIRPKQGEQSARFIANGAVELYHDNLKTFETISTGVKLTNGGAANDTPAKLQLHSEDTSIVAGDHVGEIRFTGRDQAGAGTQAVCALIDATAAADWDTSSSGYHAANIDFHTQDNSGTDTVAAGPRMRLDSSGRLLLGTTTEGNISADDLTVAGSGDTGITVRSGTGNSGNLFFSDGTSGVDEYRGYLQYQHSTNQLAIGTNGTAALTLSSSQNATFAGTVTTAGVTIDGAYEQVSEAVSALDIDVSTGNYFTKTINANSTFTFSNPAASGTVSAFTLELTHTSGTITWPTTVVWNGGVGKTAPTVATGKTHLFMFVTDDAGTTYRGAVLADYDNAA